MYKKTLAGGQKQSVVGRFVSTARVMGFDVSTLPPPALRCAQGLTTSGAIRQCQGEPRACLVPPVSAVGTR